ncbi:MAG: 2-amino-4-hydroxy-6-hydroxymethyldihydropteridine diphosphokinase, partial [Cyanobium sp.]
IALGSNLGDSQAILEAALLSLDGVPGVRLLARSRWYRSAAVGPVQPDYLNGCALLEVGLAPDALLEELHATEQRFGRVRRERWGPRTLDLDLILYGTLQLESGRLQVPHPRFRERAFVLLPLAEIAPAWIDPLTGRTVADLAHGVADRRAVQPLEALMAAETMQAP